MDIVTIAIDGPGGAGKSTIARKLAARLGVLYLDTGAMYRAMGYKALREGVDVRDEAALQALLAETEISAVLGGEGQRTFLDGQDVSSLIRTPEVSAAASAVAKAAAVRTYMVARQQACARASSMVVDGRDIGTRVLPDATHKFFLTASAEVRARRRYAENLEKGVTVPYEEVLADMIARDKQDSEREVDPLCVAEGAIVVDSSDLTIDEVIAVMQNTISPPEGDA